MNETDAFKKILPMSALDDIPTAKADAKAIVAKVIIFPICLLFLAN